MLRVLIPIDGSVRSLKSLELLKEMYAPGDVSVTLIRVCENESHMLARETLAEQKEAALGYLTNLAENLPDYNCACRVAIGSAGEEILRAADEEETDIIIMTRSSSKNVLARIGSVTSYVVKHAICMVLITPDISKEDRKEKRISQDNIRAVSDFWKEI